MDISKLKIDRSLKKRLNSLLEEFEASKVLSIDEKSRTFLQNFFN